MTKTDQYTKQVVHDQSCRGGDLQGSVGENATRVHGCNQQEHADQRCDRDALSDKGSEHPEQRTNGERSNSHVFVGPFALHPGQHSDTDRDSHLQGNGSGREMYGFRLHFS